jgi:hypothetical protein
LLHSNILARRYDTLERILNYLKDDGNIDYPAALYVACFVL